MPAAVLRSSGLEIYGSGAGTAPVERIMEAMPQFIAYAVSGKLHIDVKTVHLSQVENAWHDKDDDNRRIVFVP
ncbi:hypothetical protein [Ktedonospora formicarum]|uniref:Alcohol dehydrogenase n=1 Tax=Ktedonospora formicarum TaxID=2778364 RepID=A0A8J3HR00_9CHLR|nr:hypothetical protein [Ktedonospora formicarum]GHO41999.1 hypothetical protein KSX_01620 [Ktedonospora formicarum]